MGRPLPVRGTLTQRRQLQHLSPPSGSRRRVPTAPSSVPTTKRRTPALPSERRPVLATPPTLPLQRIVVGFYQLRREAPARRTPVRREVNTNSRLPPQHISRSFVTGLGHELVTEQRLPDRHGWRWTVGLGVYGGVGLERGTEGLIYGHL